MDLSMPLKTLLALILKTKRISLSLRLSLSLSESRLEENERTIIGSWTKTLSRLFLAS